MAKTTKKKVDFKKVKTFPIKKRKNKVDIKQFSDLKPKSVINSFYYKIPDIQAGSDFKDFTNDIVSSYLAGEQIILMMGAHVIKCGLSRLIIDLMKRGVIKHIAMNGAGAIHDFELAMIGQTSEDVGKNLQNGTFGMADETGKLMNKAINKAMKSKMGFGAIIGKAVKESKFKYKEISILKAAYDLKIPVTIHVAIGTDIIHQHPTFDGAATGRATHRDFQILTESISKLQDGVLLNFGSAVIMPEVFLKALTIVKNLGFKINKFTSANFDMNAHYRPRVNIVNRPTQDGGKGYYFVGMHELMLPLLHDMIISKIEQLKQRVINK